MENSKYANWLPRLAAGIIDNLILSDLVLSYNYNLIETAINLIICIVYFTILLPKKWRNTWV